MKGYTDIEQSKKLSEILPLESADMCYCMWDRPLAFFQSYERANFINCDNNAIPCWSLAALLDVLPEIQGGKPVIALDDNYITYPHISDLHTKADNIVDACVVMIIKLHELNLL